MEVCFFLQCKQIYVSVVPDKTEIRISMLGGSGIMW